MSTKVINTDIPEPEEQPAIRLEYDSPSLEEYGVLHELTHGIGMDETDPGGASGPHPGMPPI